MGFFMKYLVLAFALLGAASAYAVQVFPCDTPVKTQAVSVLQCDAANNERYIMLTVNSGAGKKMLEIHAKFDLGTREHLFRKLWSVPANEVVGASEQRILSELLAGPERAKLSESAFTMLDFLASFVEPGFRVENFDLSARRPSPGLTASFTSICESVGKRRNGYFSVLGHEIKKRALVGGEECVGKCGPLCGMNRNQGKYTQECFNHDLCRRYTGENMGECEDEFWAAADGFVNAPTCL